MKHIKNKERKDYNKNKNMEDNKLLWILL